MPVRFHIEPRHCAGARRHLSLNGGVANALLLGAEPGHTDARYSEDCPQQGLSGQQGQRLANTEVLTAHLYADYRQERGNGGKGYLRVDYNDNSRRDRQPGPGMVGGDATIGRADPVSQLSARLGYQRDTWDLSLFVDNKGEQSRSLWRNTQYYMSGTPRPRTIGLTLPHNR